jgi:hypothetical protein
LEGQFWFNHLQIEKLRYDLGLKEIKVAFKTLG